MTTAQELDERYGRTAHRRWPWIALGVLSVIVIAIAAWVVGSRSADTVDADDLGFNVVDAHTVEVRFQVTIGAERKVFCALEALDEEYGVVGWKVIEVPASGTSTRQLRQTIPTVAEATTGLVNSCWVA